MAKQAKGAWSPRFARKTSSLAAEYTESVSFDRRLALSDVECSLAHAKMLRDRGIIGRKDHAAIAKGLGAIRKEVESGEFAWDVADEDVHMNVERRLIELVGDAGKRLHTARSRNDQVATDIRHWLRGEIEDIVGLLGSARLALLDLAEGHCETLMPGFTHLQVAQPITFGHHLLAYDQMLARDQDRMRDCRRRMNRSPLGACALAGTGFDVDPARVASDLGFDGACENSLDAVSDRDHLIEFCSAASLCMMHFSRLGEELVLWSSQAMGFVEIPDEHSTGSSIMPQKRNPDVAELARGKTGRVYGDLMALLTVMKGQPLAYNRDNQEDKEPVFDCVDTLKGTLRIFASMIPGIRVRPERMLAMLERGHVQATELADHLVRKGIPFREAHGIVSALVRKAEERGCALGDLSDGQLGEVSPHLGPECRKVLDMGCAVRSRKHPGGTSPKNCRSYVARARRRLAASQRVK